MRLHQMREKGFTLRKGKRIGKNERLVTWIKPAHKPKSTELSDDEWDQLPATMEMRMISFWHEDRDGAKKKMVLATTLLDNDTFDWIELGELYATRWDIELRLRDVKTTLGMEALNVKTPDMAGKSLAMALLGFNLVKAICGRSVGHHPEKWKLISFKGALDAIKGVQSLFSMTATKTKKSRAVSRPAVPVWSLVS
ncbi:MAG: transposase [Verrucomicrobia bacterium]|nr:transposase [Verrucomicrobiota bacterium]MDA1005224.1 transposase [Verrucomicrobiota bacterium]